MNHEDPYDSTLVYTVSGIVKDFDRTVLPNETQLIANMERFPQVMGYTLRPHSFAYSSTGACKAFLMLHPGATLDAKSRVLCNTTDRHYVCTAEQWLWYAER